MAFKRIDEIPDPPEANDKANAKAKVTLAYTPGLTSPYFRFSGNVLDLAGLRDAEAADVLYDEHAKQFLVVRGAMFRFTRHPSGSWIQIGGAPLRKFFQPAPKPQLTKWEVKPYGKGKGILLKVQD